MSTCLCLKRPKPSTARQSRNPLRPPPGTPAGKAATERAARPALNLRAALAGVRQGTLNVTDLSFILKGADGKYNVSALTCNLGSGGTLKGSVGADLHSKAYSLNLAAAGVNVGALLAALGQGRPWREQPR